VRRIFTPKRKRQEAEEECILRIFKICAVK
jgi:hypothetical protein